MNSPLCVAANMSANERKTLALFALAKTQPVTQLADQQGVSRRQPIRSQNWHIFGPGLLRLCYPKRYFLNHAHFDA